MGVLGRNVKLVCWGIASFAIDDCTCCTYATAIDGQRYVTWFDLADKDLAGLAHGCRVEFIARPAPTILCHSPRIEENLPSARLMRALANTVPGTGSSQEAR